MNEKYNKINNHFHYWKVMAVLSFLFVFLFLIKIDLFAQQDPQYSQYMFNQLAINPAYAGAKEAISTTMFLRKQWSGFENGGEPKTESITIHSPMRKRKVALGFAITGDQIGPKNTIGILGSYAYRIKLGKGKLSMGLRLGVYRYNWGSINFKDEADPYNQGRIQQTSITPTADAGIYYYTNTTYAGLSMTHLDRGRLTRPIQDTTDSRLAFHAFLTGGKAWELSEKLIFNPSFMIKVAENTPTAVDLNLSFLLQKRLWMGLSLRSNYAFVVYTQVYINDKFKIGYAFDFGASRLVRQFGGTHEIMLSYDFKISKPPFASPRYF